MPNEFIVKNGLISQDNITVTGSIIATGGITISGSIASASYASNAELLDGLDSTAFTLTSSFNTQTASFTAFTSSINSFSASVNTFSASILTYTSSLNAKTSSFATTGSNTFIGTETISGSLVISGSGTPFTLNTDTLEITGSLIVSGSTTLTGSLLQSGNFTTTGTLTAQTLVVQTITSSVDFVTGSTRFGSLSSNTHVFTGSLNVTGALYVATGSVGIGTTSPSSKLTIESSTYDDFIKLTRTSIGSMGISATNPRGIQTTDGAGNFIGWHVDSSGSVGINTTTPSSTLNGLDINSGGLTLVLGGDISANTRTNNTQKVARIVSYPYANSALPVATLITNNDGTNNTINIGGNSSFAAAATYINFFTTSSNINTATGTQRMTITPTGEVGIGVDPSTGNRFWVKGNDSSSSNSSLIAQNSSGTFLLFVRNDGNIGINTSVPSAKLNTFKTDDLTTVQVKAETDTSSVSSYVGLAPSVIEYYRGVATGVDLTIQTKIAAAGGGGGIVFAPNSPTTDYTPVERMKISKAGVVTMPYQPAFHAYGVSQGSYASNSYWVFPSTILNRGSHYNTSTGIFTAPVAGVYQFTFSNLGGTGTTVYRYFLYINNSQTQQGPPLQLRMDKGGTSGAYGTNFSRVAVVNLAANDTVRIFYSSDTSETSYPNTNDATNEYSVFMGHLLG